MKRALFLALALLAGAAPLAAQDLYAQQDAAEDRLRVCIINAAPGAPRDSIDAAVAALRSLCYPQIVRLREARQNLAEDKLGLPAGRLTADQKLARERSRAEASRDLDAEIIRVISNATGVTRRETPPAISGPVTYDADNH